MARDGTKPGRAVPGDAIVVHAAADWSRRHLEWPADPPCLWDAERRLALAGDGCLGPRVEAAFDCGEAAADRVLMALDIPPAG